MDRNLALPALVLLDEVGAGTDPIEGGALGTAVIDHFRTRGAHLVATTHYDALKTYASTTEGVESAAFGFDPATFAPTYRADLRLARAQPGDRDRGAARHAAGRHRGRAREPVGPRGAARGAPRARRSELRALEAGAARPSARARLELAENERRAARAAGVAAREGRRVQAPASRAKVDDQLRDARREIDAVIDGLKARATVLRDKRRAPRCGRRSAPARPEWRAPMRAPRSTRCARGSRTAASRAARRRRRPRAEPLPDLEPGVRVSVGPLGLEGTVIEIHGKHAEVDVSGKRLRAAAWRPARHRARRAAPRGQRQHRPAAAHRLAVGAERHRLHRRRGLDANRPVPRRDHADRHARGARRPRPRHRPAAARDGRLPQGASAGRALRAPAARTGRRRRDGRRAKD